MLGGLWYEEELEAHLSGISHLDDTECSRRVLVASVYVYRLFL